MKNVQSRVLTCSVMLTLALGAGFPANEARATDLATPATLPQSEAEIASTEARTSHWALDAALFNSFSGKSSVNSTRFIARRLVTESFSAGMDLRYWTAGSYPLARDAGAGVWAGGANGQFDLFRGRHFGAHVGASFLWVPGPGQFTFVPEAGFKWFASDWLAFGVSYSVLTDLGSSIISFEPAASGHSRQSLGLELSVYL